MGRKNKQKKLIKFCRKILNCLEKAGVRRFSSRFSKKTYSRRVHVVLLALRQSFDKSYRRFVEWLECSTEVLAFLGIKKAPHFTTLQKAAARFGTAILNEIIGGFVFLTKNKKVRLGIDSTGLQPTRASAYYTTVLKRQNDKKGKKKPPGPGRRKIRRHIKHTVFVDLDKQLIVSQKTRRGPASDHRDFKPAVKKGHRVLKKAGKKVRSFDGDKGYDSEENHRLVVEVLGAEDRMKLKNKALPVSRTSGRYRKKAKRRIRRLRANYRAKNETVFSVEKGVCSGSTVRSVKVGMQNREVLFKDIAYNAHRLASIFAPILEDFYRAVSSRLSPRSCR